MLVEKEIIDNDIHFKYKYYDYKYENNPNLNINREYKRYKCVKRLEHHINKLLKTSNDISGLLLYGIAHNLNDQDPVLITITKDAIEKNYTIDGNVEDLDGKIELLNNKVGKYVSKLAAMDSTIDDNFDKFEEVENIIFSLKDKAITKIPIRTNVYNKVKGRYDMHRSNNNTDLNLDQLIWSALFRYKYLGILDGNQGAVSEEDLQRLNKKHNTNVELFGSVINTSLKYYCSMFYDLERWFGSVGNFFNTTLISGFYEMNPPFIVWIMEAAFAHIRKCLDATKQSLSIFITIPVWDIHDRLKLNPFCNTTKSTDYENPKLDSLKRTKYIIIDRLYCQNDYGYTDYVQLGQRRNPQMKNIHFVQTNVIVVSNNKDLKLDLDFLPNKYIDA